MSEPTNTRKTLRRAIALELGMPFFRRFSSGESATDTGSTASKIIDAALTQSDRFWNGSWNYMLGTAEQGIIRSYDVATKSFQLEPPLAAAPADTGDLYEIHTIWNAAEIHDAINQAIQEVNRIFTETIVDKTLIVQEDIKEYDLTGLARRVLQLNKVYVENPASVQRGTASAGGATTITVESVPTGINTSWKISIYDGLGKGQIRNYVSNIGNAITVAAWTTNPDNTSKYAIWDASEEAYDWVPLHKIYTDSLEYPDVLRFRGTWAQLYGLRMRLEYLSAPTSLTSDSDTTIVPLQFIIYRSVATLHGRKIGDVKADRDLHYSEEKRYSEKADLYVARNAPHMPSTNIPSAEQDTYIGTQQDDPLDW